MYLLRNLLVRISAVIILGIFCLGKSGFCANQTLKFRIILDKTEYSAEEPINVTFVLKNLSSSPVLVNQRFYISSPAAAKNQKEVHFEIISPLGEKLTCKNFYETGYPKTDYFKLLQPAEEVKSEYPRNLRGFFDITEPGTYRLVAVYQNVWGAELGLDTFQEQLVSDPVKFSVVNTKK